MNMSNPLEGSITIPLDFFDELASFYYSRGNRYSPSTGASINRIKTYKDVECQTDIEYTNEKTSKVVVDLPSSLTQSTISSKKSTEETTVVYDQNKESPLRTDINKQPKKLYAVKSSITKKLLTERQQTISTIDQIGTANVTSAPSKSSNGDNKYHFENDRIQRMKKNERRRDKFRILARTLDTLANIDPSLDSTSYNKQLEKRCITTLVPLIRQIKSEPFEIEDHHHH
ncbi:unnamed protein product [Rotaria sordida]|uniref:Uncharacterized protein n=1 Tax=Rotaria sordida TaxID=392033 RepID=A0A814J5R3_9BILA|nr:unnamed protein product [Rotaria sordida]CAF1192731.1 unnamed protein product [Rotaria sordida]